MPSVQLSTIENKCLVTPISFVKNTYLNPTIRQRLQDTQLPTLLNQVLIKTIALSGMKEKSDQFMIDEIMKMFFTIYSHLTPEEIYKAFELERMRLYEKVTEHFQLFDTGYAAEILKKYENWKQQLKVKHNISKESVVPIQNQLPAVSESQKKKLLDEGIKRCFEEYKETKSILPPFKHVFEELVSRGIIAYPTEKSSPKLKEWYSEKRKLAKEKVESEIKSEILNPDRTKSKTFLNQILAQVEQGESEKITLKLYEIILKGVFQKRIDSGLTIEDWLK